MVSYLKTLFNVVRLDAECCEIVLSDEKHPIFLAHFESNPILPGFLHIDIAAFLFGLDVYGVKKAKYFEIVRPLDRLMLKCIEKSDNYYVIEITNSDCKCVSKLELYASKVEM
jgi:3-hydroxyacyl-[acyl-carrier-protein] dehydratase